MFADDCLIYKIGNTWERMVPQVQEGLDSFQQWCLDNRMKLNVKKCKSLVIGTYHKLKDLNLYERFTLNNIFLDNVSTYNYLGFLIDCNMIFAKVTKVIMNKIYNLVKIRNCIDVKCALTIYKHIRKCI